MRFSTTLSLLAVLPVFAACSSGGNATTDGTTTTSSGGQGTGGAGSGTSGTGGANSGATATSSGSTSGATTTTSGSTSSSASSGGGAPAPTFAVECGAADSALWDVVKQPAGTVGFGVSDAAAEDGAVCSLTLHGDAALGSADHTGPGFASEIDSKATFSFGTYRTRVELAACAASEEAVNGIFTFFNDGADHNGNGLIDNSEIDIEILCGQPNFILLSSWTDYEDATGKFFKWSRAVDTATGDILESPSDHEYGVDKVGNSPDFKHPGFPEAGAFYEMGFEWHSDHIRFFIVLDGQEITLWDFKDQKLIPQHEAPFLFNVWHPGEHWYEDGAPDYPAADTVMHVDWFRYWASPT